MTSTHLKTAEMSTDAEPGRVHKILFHFCMSLLDRGTIKVPDHSDPKSDRGTTLMLSQEDLATAAELGTRYRRWLDTFIDTHVEFLASEDVNLLRTNRDEIGTYLVANRRGQDTTVEMFRDFWENELHDLLRQQDDVCASVSDTSKQTNMARRRRCWRGVPLTLGIEEEHQIVAADTGELTSNVEQILSNMRSPQFGHEVYKSQIELKTGVCSDIGDMATALLQLRRQLKGSLPAGLSVFSAGTHPFSTWNTQQANQTARTDVFMHDMQDVVRRLVTFGLHVHVGIEDKDLAVQIMNSARRFLPFLLALSTSSPFWEARVTGLRSYRSTVFSSLPRTGVPPTFDDRHAYDDYLDLLGRTHSFDSARSFDPTKIWWDIRLHPEYDTIEFRVADACTRSADSLCIAALCQAIVAKLAKLIHGGVELTRVSRHIIEENKWRAIRYGRKARFIDEATRREVTARYQAAQLMDFVEDVVEDLGSHDHVRRAIQIVDEGASADFQLAEYARSRNWRDVTNWLAGEFLTV